jgi:hypothetical protein
MTVRAVAQPLGRLILVAGLAILIVFGTKALVQRESRVDPYLNFITAHLEVVRTGPGPVSSDARFTRSTAKFTTLEHVDPALDACAGPVAVHLPGDRPLLIAEHDYCGGSDWMSKIVEDDLVQLTGPGVQPGLYSAEEITLVPRYESTLKDLPDADVVLQTCVSRTQMVLVGLTHRA